MLSIITDTKKNDSFENRSYTIGQASELLKCSKSLLRYYEAEFALNISRSSSNRRFYTNKQLELFRYIFTLKESNYSNAQIKKVLLSRENDFEKNITESSYSELKNTDETGILSTVNELRNIIYDLRSEVIELKKMNESNNSKEIAQENKILKERLKEKTYELVDAREKLSKIKKKKFK